MSQIDRANIGFAKLQFQEDLGITSAAFGWAAGIFSLGYIAFEVPSNLMLHKVGARLTLLRIMTAWGAVTIALMFANSATSLYVLRFLLGLAEGGFFPGIILYISYWFPDQWRGRATALFLLALPVSGMIGGPLAGWIMDSFDGVHGLRGWQWLFFLEGIPAILMGVISYVYLPDRPATAQWLTVDEKQIIADDTNRSSPHEKDRVTYDFLKAIRAPTVWLLTLVYLGYYFSLTSISIWWPTLLNSVGARTITQTGLLSGLISAAAAAAMILVSRHSDKTGERRWHVALCGITGAVGFLSLSLVSHSMWATVGVMAISTAAIFSLLGLFWTIPPQYLGGRAAAGGIAIISSFGNLAGFFAPIFVGTLKDRTGSLYVGLGSIALLLIGAMLLLLVVVPRALGVTRSP
jgi:MFS family permease